MKYEKSILDAHDSEVFIISFKKNKPKQRNWVVRPIFLGFDVREGLQVKLSC